MGSSVGCERDESERARALDRLLELALVRRAGSGDAPWKDLPSLGNESLKQLGVLVVDERDLLVAESAELSPSEEELLPSGPLRLFTPSHARPPSMSPPSKASAMSSTGRGGPDLGLRCAFSSAARATLSSQSTLTVRNFTSRSFMRIRRSTS